MRLRKTGGFGGERSDKRAFFAAGRRARVPDLAAGFFRLFLRLLATFPRARCHAYTTLKRCAMRGSWEACLSKERGRIKKGKKRKKENEKKKRRRANIIATNIRRGRGDKQSEECRTDTKWTLLHLQECKCNRLIYYKSPVLLLFLVFCLRLADADNNCFGRA